MNVSINVNGMTTERLLSWIAIITIIIAIGYSLAKMIIELARAFFRTFAGNDPHRLAGALVPIFVMLIVAIAVIATTRPILGSMAKIQSSALTKLTNTRTGD